MTRSTGPPAPDDLVPGARRRGRLSEDLRAVLPVWVAARCIVALAWALAGAVARADRPGGTTLALDQGLLAWDGSWYEAIARVGYGGLPEEGLRFFPLYPMVGRLVAVPLGGRDALALVLVANLVALAVAVVLRRLVLDERGDVALADRAVALTLLFPSAFVLVWAYSEALFLLGAVGAVWAARRRQWWLAAACGAVAGATRPLGLLLAVPLVVEAVLAHRGAAGAGGRTDGRGWVTWAGRAAAVVGPVVGTGAYLLWVGSTEGDPWLPFTVQSPLRGEAVDPVSRLFQGLGDLVGPERWGDGLHLPFVLAAVALVVVTFRTWPPVYGLLGTVLLLTAVSADNLNSFERYALNAFPLVLGLAAVTAAPRAERLALAVAGCGLLSLTALAWLGTYVP